jgi:hypothetical protein
VFSYLADCVIAHFGCHAESHPDDPSRSRLLLHDHETAPLDVASLFPGHPVLWAPYMHAGS